MPGVSCIEAAWCVYVMPSELENNNKQFMQDNYKWLKDLENRYDSVLQYNISKQPRSLIKSSQEKLRSSRFKRCRYKFKTTKNFQNVVAFTRYRVNTQKRFFLTRAGTLRLKLRLHTAINRADFVSWWMWFTIVHLRKYSVIFSRMHFVAVVRI